MAQEHCVSRPYHIGTELFPGNQRELDYQDYFAIYSDGIEFDGIKYAIKDLKIYPFENKDDLLRYFSCNHDFLSASENIIGELIEYELEVEIPRVGNTFQYIHFNDCGSRFHHVYVDDGLYRFSNTPFFEEAEITILEKTKEEEIVVEYSYNVDTSALVYYVEEPEFEVVTEQFLLKYSYSVLEAEQTEFEDSHTLIYHEVSSCTNVLYDTIYEQILVKEGSVGLEITPAVFETVSEYRLIQNKFEGEIFYERIPLDSLVIALREEYREIDEFNVSEGCSEFVFFECIDVDFNLIPSKDTALYNVFENCEEGYKSAGKYCYHNSGTVPWKFELRTYEKLAQPAYVTEVIMSKEYKTIPLIRIMNKEDLDSNCLEIIVDSILYQKVIVPSTVKETLVPAVYETLEYDYYQDGGIIEVVEGEPDSNLQLLTIRGGSYEFEKENANILLENRVCSYESIQRTLIEAGYLDESQIDNIAAFQLAIVTFQINNELPLGVIDVGLVNALEIKFGF